MDNCSQRAVNLYKAKTRLWMLKWMFPKIVGFYPPKMDGLYIMENPMNKWMIWVVFPHYFWVNTEMVKVEDARLSCWQI